MDWDDGSAAILVQILDSVEEVDLISAVQRLEGIRHWHGGLQHEIEFKYAVVQSEITACLHWASNPVDRHGHSLTDELKHVGEQRLATLRAWTGDVCYVVTSRLRYGQRTLEWLAPVLPLCKLFFAGLHQLPERFHFQGDLHRAEHGARTTWDTTVKTGLILQWFTPLSFSHNSAVLQQFMGSTGERTVVSLQGACGYIISDISLYPKEDEVVMESITRAEILEAYKQADGLHYVRAKATCSLPMLSKSPVHAKTNLGTDTEPWITLLERAGLGNYWQQLKQHGFDSVQKLKTLGPDGYVVLGLRTKPPGWEQFLKRLDALSHKSIEDADVAAASNGVVVTVHYLGHWPDFVKKHGRSGTLTGIITAKGQYEWIPHKSSQHVASWPKNLKVVEE